MTLFNMIERVKMIYPNEHEENIKRYINDSYKDFCVETKLLRRALGITLVNGENVYPIPPDVIAISRIDLYDSEDTVPRNVDLAVTDVDDNYVLNSFGDLTYTSPATTEAFPIEEPSYSAKWYIENTHLVINVFDGTNESIPTGTPAVAVINYIRLPEYMDSYTEEPLIDQRWHDPICSKVISTIALKATVTKVDRNGTQYQTTGDLQMHSYWKAIYDKAVFEAKRVANNSKLTQVGNVRAYYF